MIIPFTIIINYNEAASNSSADQKVKCNCRRIRLAHYQVILEKHGSFSTQRDFFNYTRLVERPRQHGIYWAYTKILFMLSHRGHLAPSRLLAPAKQHSWAASIWTCPWCWNSKVTLWMLQWFYGPFYLVSWDSKDQASGLALIIIIDT